MADAKGRATVERLARRGCQCESVELLSEARSALDRNEYRMVIAAEIVRDGCAYELADLITRCTASLLVGVQVSDGFLWFPAVERGLKTLGNRAVNSQMLESEVDQMLSDQPSSARPDSAAEPFARTVGPRPKRALPPRRKSVGAR